MRKRIGIDTNLMIRQAARRMLVGAAEGYGWKVYVPAQVACEARNAVRAVYVKQEARRARSEARERFEDPESREAREWREEVTSARADARRVGFASWLDNETLHNEPVMDVGWETEEGKRLADRLVAETSLVDPGDAAWIAQAVLEGVPVVATDNRRSIPRDEVQEFLVEWRGTHDPERWILSPDEAIRRMVADHAQGWSRETVAATAYAVGRSAEEGPPEEEAQRLGVFANALREAGATRTGGKIAEAVSDARTADALLRTLRSLAPDVDRTRASQDRLLRAEARLSEIPCVGGP